MESMPILSKWLIRLCGLARDLNRGSEMEGGREESRDGGSRWPIRLCGLARDLREEGGIGRKGGGKGRRNQEKKKDLV